MASSNKTRNRYIDELLSSASTLSNLDSAAIAEAWASSAVAEWASLGEPHEELGPLLLERSPLAAALIGWIHGGDRPMAGADWVCDVGQHEVRGAMRLVAESNPGEVGWILEYEAPSGDRHDLSATVLDGRLVGLSVGPEGLAFAAADDESSGFAVSRADAQEVIDHLRSCLAEAVDGLSDESEATLPLLARRLGITSSVVAAATTIERQMPERDLQEDHYGADVLASALRSELGEVAPDAVHQVHARAIELFERADADLLTLGDVGAVDLSGDVEMGTGIADLDTFVRLVGAYFAPVQLDAHTEEQFCALVELEPADWIGVVLGMTRAPVGLSIDGDVLVTFINRAPEITTTIPKRDAARIAWTFEQMLYSWQVTGVLDDDGAVSGAAAWLLPRAALAAWGRASNGN